MRTSRRTWTVLASLAAVALMSGCTGKAVQATAGHAGSPSTPSTATASAPATTSTPTPEAVEAAAPSADVTAVVAAPTSIVPAWARQSFHGLSFITPAVRADVQIDEEYDPHGHAQYTWNVPSATGVPPVSVTVYASVRYPEALHVPGQDPAPQAQPTTVRGATDAYLTPSVHGADARTRLATTVTEVQFKSVTDFYRVTLTVPAGADGNALTGTMLRSLKVS